MSVNNRLDESCKKIILPLYEAKKKEFNDTLKTSEWQYFKPEYCFSKKMSTCLYVGGYHDSKKWERWIFNAATNEMLEPVFDYINKADRPTSTEFTEVIQLEGASDRFWNAYRKMCR